MSTQRYAFEWSEKKTTHRIQESEKLIGQNNNYGRKRWILYRYSTTEFSSNRSIKEYKSSTSWWTSELLFCRRRQSQWQKKNEYDDWRNIDNSKNSTEQISILFYFQKCMKKFLSITMLIIYIFSINTLVHASTMGFFSHNNNEIWHCSNHQQSQKNKTQNVDCCEIAFSNQYSDTQIQLEYPGLQAHSIPSINHLIKNIYTYAPSLSYKEWPPWRNPDIKYNKFSDLFGSIVNLS